MRRNKGSIIGAFIVIIVLAIGAYYFFKSRADNLEPIDYNYEIPAELQ